MKRFLTIIDSLLGCIQYRSGYIRRFMTIERVASIAGLLHRY